MDNAYRQDVDSSPEQSTKDKTVVAALVLVGIATLIGAFEEASRWSDMAPAWWVQRYALPLLAPAITLALWAYTSRLERRAGINLVRGQLVLLIGLSFVAALPSISAGHSFSLFYGVLLLLLATKISDQRLVIGGVIATVAWLSLALGIIYTGYSLLLLITGGLILGCVFVPKNLRSTPQSRR
ncbi:hypothetical protein FJV46_14655 [Arthrobacter agilis]|uniref:hypothetical protein n=1 Tax=Arthrobacter agilis TaxID=37921 RepID=UPI000CE3B6C2|nr:hypothetical protein [Arthrobacter agilis]PPB47451.1 hypothetical protein CI784_01400 [Arthrobacter agilis]TPV21771.1 hypothetical protein FJV46_14655 [Arthrobacter agilis]VDR32222.1 Uncharacterised protein [Arthrobacter agilis]